MLWVCHDHFLHRIDCDSSVLIDNIISLMVPHCSDGSCHVPIFLGTKPSGRAQFPKFVLMRCVRINWRRETRRREEGLVVVLIEIDVDLQLIVTSIAFSLHPPKHHCCLSSTLDRQFVAQLPMLSTLASCKQQLCYGAHCLPFGLVIVLLNFLALFWFWPRSKWDLIVC